MAGWVARPRPLPLRAELPFLARWLIFHSASETLRQAEKSAYLRRRLTRRVKTWRRRSLAVPVSPTMARAALPAMCNPNFGRLGSRQVWQLATFGMVGESRMRPDVVRAFVGTHVKQPTPKNCRRETLCDNGASQLHQRAIVSVCNVLKTNHFALMSWLVAWKSVSIHVLH